MSLRWTSGTRPFISYSCATGSWPCEIHQQDTKPALDQRRVGPAEQDVVAGDIAEAIELEGVVMVGVAMLCFLAGAADLVERLGQGARQASALPRRSGARKGRSHTGCRAC